MKKSYKINAVCALLILAFFAFGCRFGKIVAVGEGENVDRGQTGFRSDEEDANRPETETRDENPSSVAGTYEYDTESDGEGFDNSLEITDAGDGKLYVRISGSYIYRIGETRSTRESEAGGDAVLRGGKADATLVDEAGRPCRATINFKADTADVRIPDTCRFDIALGGVYKKAGSKAERAKEKPENNSGLREIGYAGVMDFINDFDARRVGEEFIITEVPPAILDKKNRADEFGSRSYKDLFYLAGVTDDDTVSYSVLTSAAMIESLNREAEYEPAVLRMTAVIVESKGKFDVYRLPFITKIEALGDDGAVMWTARGGAPEKVNFTH